MLVIRRPSNHAFTRGGDGVDREGRLLTFANLGRDRGSFDWLSPVVFSGLVLHVELCDRQRNRAGGVTDGDGPDLTGLTMRYGGRYLNFRSKGGYYSICENSI